MPLLAAARESDTIAHTSMLAMIGKVGTGLLVGAALGFLAGVATAALVAGTVLSGGLVGIIAGAVISGLMLRAVGANSIIENASNAVGDILSDIWPPTNEGVIAESSPDVSINSKQAARAVGEGEDNIVLCKRHPPMPNQYLAEGSASVFINSFPAHRKSERTTCDAHTSSGSNNVFIGGDSLQTREITSEMPWWLNYASMIIGIALALCTRNWKSIPGKLACLGLNIGINAAVEYGLTAVFGKPVHATTGSKLLDGSDDTDFVLPARIPVEWVRRYSSLDQRDGLFGPGWSVPFSVQLRINQAGEHPNIFIDLQGREVPFDTVEPGQSLWNTAEGWRLARTMGGNYIVEGLDGLYRDFGTGRTTDDDLSEEEAIDHQDDSGLPLTLSLQRIEDFNGNYIALRYDCSGKLHEIADCAGRLYTCEYDVQHSNRLAAILLHVNETTPPLTLARYKYDNQGRLNIVSNRAGEVTRSFSWHDNGPGAGLMARHMLPTGLECWYEWGSFADHPRVIAHRTSDGLSWQAHYLLHDTPLGGGQTIVTDHLGNKQTWEWNHRAQITSYTDALNRCTKLEWNDDSQLISCAQPNGGLWKYAYDQHGNLASETDPLGRTSTTTWRQDAPLPLKEVDAAGRIRSYEYDERHNLIAEDGTAGRTEIMLDRLGQPHTEIDPRGGISHWSWHANGQAATVTDCSGRTTSYTYNSLGQLTSETDPAGHITTHSFDNAGRQDTITLADNSTRQWRWLPNGMLESYSDGLGKNTQFAWNRQGQLTTRTDATGHSVKLDYDSFGNLSRLQNENGQIYHFVRDVAGQLRSQTGVDGLRTDYLLDAFGLPIQVTQAAQSADETRLILERDLLGRLIVKQTAETITRYTYDAIDQITRMERHARTAQGTDGARLDTLEFVYDAQGNLTEEHSTQYQLKGKPLAAPRVSVLRHQHDKLGNRIATTLPQQRTLNYLYYGSGHLHQINLDGEVISDIERDATHLEISRSQGGLLNRFQRDALGRRISQRAYHGQHAEIWGKDNQGTPLSQTGTSNPAQMAHLRVGEIVVKGFAYDANGEVIKRVDPVMGERNYAYDAMGRITGAQSPSNQASRTVPAETFAWDPASNLCQPENHQRVIPNNRLTVHGDRRYEYDTLGVCAAEI